MSNASTPTAVWLILFLCYKSRKNSWESLSTHERWCRPNRTGIESANGVVLSWREMDWLMDPHEKTTKGRHTHTHTHTQTHTHTKTSCQISHPWYLWDTLLSFLFLGGTNQTKEKSQEHNLHLVALVVLLLLRLRVCQWLERVRIGATFYRIVMLAWRHEQMVVPPKPRVTQKSSSISSLVGMTFNDILWF